MSAVLIDGRAIAGQLRTRVARDVPILGAKRSVTPGLAVVPVGEDSASSVYVKTKAKQAQAVGLSCP
jgi:methylenetetrahydrofolate dehydrogenase (NADP+)/methenyltetrahydrofolate cyclohydrolase